MTKGYSNEVCIQCESAEQTITYPNFKITQISKCRESLRLQENPLDPVKIDVGGQSNENSNVTSGWQSFFTNSEETECPVSQCILKNQGCQKEYTGTNLYMERGYPWRIRSSNDVDYGKNEKVCIECSNSDQTIQHDGFSVLQINSCLSSLATKTGGRNSFTFLKYGMTQADFNGGNGRRLSEALTGKGADYRGLQNVTRSGYTC